MECAKCQERGKTWNGSDPRCAFPDGQPFRSDNWNCATVGELRELAERVAHRVSWHGPLHGVHWEWGDDQNFLHLLVPEDSYIDALSLWATWYKRRGRTSAIWLLDSDYPPRPPTVTALLEIVDYWDRILTREDG